MKKILIALSVVILMGCDPSARSVDKNYSVRPKHLQDCTFDYLMNDSGGGITVVRCPNSSTTSKDSYKGASTVTTIEPSPSIEYQTSYTDYSAPKPVEETIVVNGKEYIRKTQ
jgi:hypothetical protein